MDSELNFRNHVVSRKLGRCKRFMPLGFKLIPVAVVGLALSLLVGMQLQPGQPKLSSDADYKPLEKANQIGGEHCLPAVIAALPKSKRRGHEEACQRQQREDAKQVNGLISAKRQADAADASVTLSFEQARTAAWGVALGFATMFAAGAAAFYARAAAIHTKRGADLASDAQRPHLLPDKVTFGPPDQMWGKYTLPFSVTIKNFGTIPGFVTRYRINIIVAAKLPEIKYDDSDWMDVFWPVTRELSFGHGDVRLLMRKEQFDLIAQGSKVFMTIEINYTNGLSRAFSTKAVWESMPNEHPPQPAPSKFWEYT